jgi:two-component system, NtrC family, sensor kinase
MRQPGGIRSKITFWFYLVFVFMITSSVLMVWIVKALEEKHFSIEKADVFLENILEVRRMEKNYLLYKDRNSMEEWISYLAVATRELTDNREIFVRLSSLAEIDEVELALENYQTTFTRFRNLPIEEALLAVSVRKQGNRLTTLTEELIVREHQTIHTLLALIRNTLSFMLPFFILIFSWVAVLLGRGIVSSLKQLERHAATIAAGNFVEVPFISTNREINSLINAFNRMSRELKNRQQQLVRSEKLASLGIMLAGVAHEFNNPLSNISSSAQILIEELEEKDGEYARELALQISAETNRASAIVNTLLPLAREDKFHRDVYPLKSLCQEVLVLLRGQTAADVDIQLVIADEIVIFADKQKIQQVFINLLKNSFDALAGGGTIRIRAWQHQAELKITISDDGPGISRQVQKKIFDPFFTTKDTGQGSGLGLFIVHDIIVQHGGSIGIESTGEGAAFIIRLPGEEVS